jgi:hypothetical protein
MLYYIGVFFILILNAGILFDQTYHNKELSNLNPYLVLIVMGLFFLIEVMFFSAIYMITIKTIRLF